MTTFRAAFVAVAIGTLMLVGALLLNQRRPDIEIGQPSADLIRATGKCASCHRDETEAIVLAHERSEHAKEGVTCLDCHGPADGQESYDHREFVLTTAVTAANCSNCHADQYQQFLRSRHAAPAYAAVMGGESFSAEQIEFSERYHAGTVDRPANALAQLEGEAAITSGCISCHAIGKPNPDGSIGTCTACHSRHDASLVLARTPRTCGQCHMGPDHSQLEIYEESKHGVLFDTRREEMNLAADPKLLTAKDMPVPTCATCHMSGLEGLQVTHDVTQRLSYWLFAPISARRPTWLQGQDEMKAVCGVCHTADHTDLFYEQAEEVVLATNIKVGEAEQIMEGLRADGLLSPEPFDESIEFLYFDYWHYFGRTAKHGAFMGGPDFVQWHGNYELLAKLVELRELEAGLRAGSGRE